MKKMRLFFSVFLLVFSFNLSAETSGITWKSYSYQCPSGLTCSFELPSTAVSSDLNDDDEDEFLEAFVMDSVNQTQYFIDIVENNETSWGVLSFAESILLEIMLDLSFMTSEETVTDQGYFAVDITLSHEMFNKHCKIRRIKLDGETTVTLGTIYRGDRAFFHQHLIDSFKAE